MAEDWVLSKTDSQVNTVGLQVYQAKAICRFKEVTTLMLCSDLFEHTINNSNRLLPS